MHGLQEVLKGFSAFPFPTDAAKRRGNAGARYNAGVVPGEPEFWKKRKKLTIIRHETSKMAAAATLPFPITYLGHPLLSASVFALMNIIAMREGIPLCQFRFVIAAGPEKHMHDGQISFKLPVQHADEKNDDCSAT